MEIKMKKQIVVLVLLIIGELQAGQAAIDVQKPQSVFFVIDGGSENYHGKAGALTYNVRANISTKAAPMLVSLNVLYAFLKRAYDKDNKIKPENSYFRQGNTRFNPQDWRIYYKPESTFLLMVPKTKEAILEVEQVSIEGKSSTKSSGVFYLKNVPELTPVDGEAFLKIFEDKTLLNLDKYNKENMLTDIVNYLYSTHDLRTKKGKIVDLYRSNLPLLNIMVLGHGSYHSSIAGLSIGEFQALTLLFNELNVSLMTISSCYTGGFNKKFLEDFSFSGLPSSSSSSGHFSFKKINYPVALFGIQDSTVINFISSDFSERFAEFFKLTENRNGPNWLAAALGTLGSAIGKANSHNIGQLLVPHVGLFNVILPVAAKIPEGQFYDKNKLIYDKVLVIGKVLNRKFALEQKLAPKRSPVEGLEIRADKTELVLLSIDHVEVPLIIKNDTKVKLVPTFLPMKLSKSGISVFIIDKIKVDEGVLSQTGLFTFLEKAFFTPEERETEARFFVKKLTAINDFDSVHFDKDTLLAQSLLKGSLQAKNSYVTIQDLVISAREDSRKGKLLEMHFKLNNSYQLLTYHAKEKTWSVSVVGPAPWNLPGLTPEKQLARLENKTAFHLLKLFEAFETAKFDRFKELLKEDKADFQHHMTLLIPDKFRSNLSAMQKKRLVLIGNKMLKNPEEAHKSYEGLLEDLALVK
jgi:hypothetical protein